MTPLSMLVFVTSVMWVSGKLVNLNDTVQLTVNGSCAGGEMQLDRVLKAGPGVITRPVARLVRGVWEPAEHYKDRIHHVSTSTVNLTRVNINDHDGTFEFICNGNRIDKPIQLTVIIQDVSVSEGETARIPCHNPSEGIQGVQWEKDGNLVLVQNRSSGQPEGRLSVSPYWVQTGDLSLTVKDAQLEDGGNYVCYTVDGNGEKTRGRSPAAVKVTVQRSRPGTSQQRIGSELIACMIIIGLLFIVAVTFFGLWLVSVCTARRAAGVRRPAETEMEPLGADPDHVRS